jgi:hypothetical protein
VGCTEPVVAAQLDAAAQVLVSIGDPRSAVTLSAAAHGVRGALPRSVPEGEADQAARARTAVPLTPAELAAAAEARPAGGRE